MASTNDLKNGMTLNLEGQLWNVVEFQHVKPGKGPAFVRTKLKNVMSGKVVDKTFNAGIKVDVANVDKRDMQYLYREGDDFVFMDMTDYDQPRIPSAVVGDAAELPARGADGDDRVQRRRPAVRRPAGRGRAGDRADRPRACRATAPPAAPSRPRSRPGRQVQVPLFISTGAKIKVDTRTGAYLGRA